MKETFSFFKVPTLRRHLRFFGIILTSSIGILIAMVIMFYEMLEVKDTKENELINSISHQVSYINLWLKERSNDIHEIAQLNMTKTFDYGQLEPYFQEYIRNHKEYEDLVLINKDGHVVLDTQGHHPKDSPIIVTERDYFKQAKKKEKYITDLTISKVTHMPIVIFASPIYDDAHRFNGVVFGAINAKTFDQVVNQSERIALANTYMINQKRILITQSHSQKNSQNHVLQKLQISPDFYHTLTQHAQKNPVISKNSNGEYVYTSSAWINSGKWLIVSEVKVRDALVPALQKLGYIILCIFIGFAISIFLMIIVAKKIESPIEELLEGVKSLEKGDYEMAFHRPLKSNIKEFEQLHQSFRKMSQTIHENVKLLKKVSNTCQLTKIYNRRYLIEKGQKQLESCYHQQVPCSCLLIDIDHFKKINDTYGHLAGDEVLVQVSKRLSTNIRLPSFVSRYGGEEFVVFLQGYSLNEAAEVAENTRKNIENQLIPFEDNMISCTVSIGVSELKFQGSFSIERLIKSADEMLYEAKRAGRNQVCLSKHVRFVE